MLASTRIRRPFKHELYMKTKKSMELAGFKSLKFDDKITICPVYDSDIAIPGSGPSPWFLEAVMKIIKDRNPRARINIYLPKDKARLLKVWKTGLTSSPKVHKDVIVVTGASCRKDISSIVSYLRDSDIKRPRFCVADASITYSNRNFEAKDAIISSTDPDELDKALRFMFGTSDDAPIFVGDLPSAELRHSQETTFLPEKFWFRLKGRKIAKDFLRKQDLYRQEFLKII